MITLEVLDIRGKEKKTFTFNNYESVKAFIKNITTRDLYMKRYRFSMDMNTKYFFKNNYNKEFFEVKSNYIELKVLSNGVHRELTKSRTLFNNRTLKRLLEKVQRDLVLISKESYWKFNDDRYHVIEFLKVGEKPELQSSFLVMFDKLEWDYTFLKIVLYEEKLLSEVKRVFNSYVIPLKAYKKKTKHENNIE